MRTVNVQVLRGVQSGEVCIEGKIHSSARVAHVAAQGLCQGDVSYPQAPD